MKSRAKEDGDVYLPNPEPTSPVDFLLICMEPSLGHWARSEEEATARVASGFRNFLAGIEPMLLHFAVRKFLCGNGESYHLTDFSKGAMLVEHAGNDRAVRYDRWFSLLEEEIALLTTSGSQIIAVGQAVVSHLRNRKFPRPVASILHYSPLASRARAEYLRGRDQEFRRFAESISKDEIIAAANEVLTDAGVPTDIYKDALSIIERGKLTESRLKLIYCYQLQFEAMRA